MSRRFLSCIAVASSLVALGGCASKPQSDDSQSIVDRQILDAAQTIQVAQADLYQAAALNSRVTRRPVSLLNDKDHVTTNWQGDAVQLLNQVARDRGLKFSLVGVQMPLPLDVSVQGMPYDSFLTMLRAQIGYRATIIQTSDKLVLQYNKPQP